MAPVSVSVSVSVALVESVAGLLVESVSVPEAGVVVVGAGSVVPSVTTVVWFVVVGRGLLVDGELVEPSVEPLLESLAESVDAVAASSLLHADANRFTHSSAVVVHRLFLSRM